MFSGRHLPSLAGAVLAAFVATLLGSAAPAMADPGQTAEQILATYNLVTSGNVSTNADIEGSSVIGGNLSGATFFNANAPSSPVVYLYGAQSGNLNLNSGGSLYMNGTPSGLVNYNGGGHLYTSGPPQPLGTYTAPLINLSQELAGLAQTAGNSIAGGTFNAVAGVGGMSVFDVTAASLQNALTNASINVNLGPGVSSVVVNVTGNFTEPSSANWNSLAQSVLFNFADATSVTVGNWQASILAPNAALSIAGGAINGSVFAAAFLGGGEIHNRLFAGGLSIPNTQLTDEVISSVPEPATLSLLGLGVAVTALLRRRRRNARSHACPLPAAARGMAAGAAAAR